MSPEKSAGCTMSTVLVVDDLVIFRDLVAAALSQIGYHAVCASSAQEAAEMIKQHPPDLILLDIALPGTDGLTFLERLRKTEQMANVPVILLTANASKEYVLR